MYLELEVLTLKTFVFNLLWNVLFKGRLQSSNLNCFLSELWGFLLVLSGPINIICPLHICVKDRLVYNYAKKYLSVLYKRHTCLKRGLGALLRGFT